MLYLAFWFISEVIPWKISRPHNYLLKSYSSLESQIIYSLLRKVYLEKLNRYSHNMCIVNIGYILVNFCIIYIIKPEIQCFNIFVRVSKWFRWDYMNLKRILKVFYKIWAWLTFFPESRRYGKSCYNVLIAVLRHNFSIVDYRNRKDALSPNTELLSKLRHTAPKEFSSYSK